MAGPIAHIFCALALLQSGALKVDDEKAFIVGSCYPDIRYLNVIKRSETHRNSIRWQDVIAAPTAFEKGVLLHSLVDEVRIAHLENPAKIRLPSLPFMRSQMMKFYEDSLLHHKVDNWPKIISYFDTVLPEEKMSHNLSEGALSTWHRFIKTYCMQPPNQMSIYTILNQFPELRATATPGMAAALITKTYIGIALRSFNKARITLAVQDFYDNCVALITSNAHLVSR